MDFLEHLESPEQAIAEAARVLRPSGLFFFHTFNRNFLAWLVIIKGVEWFVRNTPPRLHVLRLFLKPTEVATMCRAHGLGAVELHGMRPRLGWPFWRMLLTRRVPAKFAFKFARSTRLGFSGCARKGGRSTSDPFFSAARALGELGGTGTALESIDGGIAQRSTRGASPRRLSPARLNRRRRCANETRR